MSTSTALVFLVALVEGFADMVGSPEGLTEREGLADTVGFKEGFIDTVGSNEGHELSQLTLSQLELTLRVCVPQDKGAGI